jgi:uncharacterized Zn-binding protein involved in type VI secretion
VGDLNLKGMLNLKGILTLGDKVLVGGEEALVVLQPGQKHGDAPPVIMPPPPAAPLDQGTAVVIIVSLNQTVKAKGKAIVTQGMAMQGNTSLWPGMVLPSTKNSGVTINFIPINVKGDQAVIFPSGGSASFNTSGQ